MQYLYMFVLEKDIPSNMWMASLKSIYLDQFALGPPTRGFNVKAL